MSELRALSFCHLGTRLTAQSQKVRSKHVSFSDFHVLPLVRTSAALKLIRVTGTLALAFLDGRIAGGRHKGTEADRRDFELRLEKEGICSRKIEIVEVGVGKDGKRKRKFTGDVGDVIIH